ncbi:MAG: hypothetical protein ABFD18_14730 [Syntrophomonas sp.]
MLHNARTEINADAVYRTGASGYYHAGVFYKNGSTYRVYEQTGDGPVEYNTMNEFINGNTYLGNYYRSTVDTSSERSSIIGTCADLHANDTICYTWSDCLNPDPMLDVGSYISSEEVKEIRCDGVVEYSYEWNNFTVWGRTSDGTEDTSPTHFDISDVDYYEEHNDLGKDDPWVELSPYVQMGEAGTEWTKLNER